MIVDAKNWDTGPKLAAIVRMEGARITGISCPVYGNWITDFLSSSKPLDDQDLSDFLELGLARGPESSNRTKKICTVCTRDNKRPIMIEEGKEWDQHVKTRRHRDGIKQKHKRHIRKQKSLSQHSSSAKSDGAESGTSLRSSDDRQLVGLLHS